VVKNSRSHPEVLRELARARQHAASQVKRANNIVPWQVVALGPAAADNAGPDTASVRITSDNTAMDGATVVFNRAPHSGCVARSAADGVAVCELVDQHGDADSHDEGKVPVLATYPGEVRADVVLLPTTLMMGPKP